MGLVVPFPRPPAPPKAPVTRGRKRDLANTLFVLGVHLETARKAHELTGRMLQEAEQRLKELKGLAR